MNAELLFGQLAAEAPLHLVGELVEAVGDEGRVEFVIAIHNDPSSKRRLLAVAGMDGGASRPDPVAQMHRLHMAALHRDVEGRDLDHMVRPDVGFDEDKRGLCRRRVEENLGVAQLLDPAAIAGAEYDDSI